MKINWKRVVIVGICSELVLLVILLIARKYASSVYVVIAVWDQIGLMFLGGLWVIRKVESRFLLHGVLVGIIANVVHYVFFFTLQPIVMPNQPTDPIAMHIFSALIKILGAAIGGFVGGKLRKKSTA